MSGRARGRGAARGRPPQDVQAQQQQPIRRPGNAPAATPAPQAGGEPSQPTSGAGRAATRGGARGEPRPGVADLPTTQMAQMSIGTTDGARERPGGRMMFAEPNTRPSHITNKRGDGDGARAVKLIANYYTLHLKSDWKMMQYHVDFHPPIDSRGLRKGLLSEHKAKFSVFLFDGMQLYTLTRFAEEVTELVSKRRSDDTMVRILLKRVAELPTNSPMCIHLLNVMFRQNQSDVGMKEVQRAYYSPNSAIKLPNHRLEVWPGFNTSILQYEENIMLNLDVSHKVLRMETVLDFMYNIRNNMRGGNFRDECLKQLVGQTVMTRYNDKTYRVDDIQWDVHPRDTFERRDGPVSYVQYYKSAYNIQLNDPDQPMLMSRPKRKDQREGAPSILYLLPELCTMTGLTQTMRENFTMMKDLAIYTRVEPTKRAASMTNFMDMVKANPDVQERMQGWGVQFGASLVKLDGRQLPPEKIYLGSDRGQQGPKQFDAGPDADWSKALRSKMMTSVGITNWIIVYSSRNVELVGDFNKALQTVSTGLGLALAPANRVEVHNTSITAFLEAIRTNIEPSLQLVMVILPSNKKDLYDAIKKQCCVDTPVPSQCVTMNVLKKQRGIMSVATKVAVQLNCKLGGEPWGLAIPVADNMVIGIDSYHDSAKKGRSVGAFVASLNKSFTRYYSQTIMQSNMQELIDGLKTCMTAALKKYASINKKLPSRIWIYRDGVGDGQLAAVVEHELPQIKSAFRDLGTDYNPELLFCVVQKRINTRFFYGTDPINLKNPGPGTIVDHTVTKREAYDFFLVSQSVRQGTVTPSRYNIIYDTTKSLTPARVQRLTYKLCHLYFNWPGTIRVPAPCQYAHKLAFLVGQSIHRSPDVSLADKLYYL